MRGLVCFTAGGRVVFGFGVSCLGFPVSCLEFLVSCLGFTVSGLQFEGLNPKR